MRKLTILFATLLATLLISGCGSNNDNNDYRNTDNNHATTLFLVDEQGFSYGEIPYKCESMTHWSKTRSNGAFTFIQPDTCTFDFNGLDGVFGDNYDDVVRIVDYVNSGKGDIPYECRYFGVSSTYTDGSFSYNANDECTFEF